MDFIFGTVVRLAVGCTLSEIARGQGFAPTPLTHPATEEGTPEWRVLVYGGFGNVSEQLEWIAQAFGIISEEAKRDEQSANRKKSASASLIGGKKTM